MVLGGACVTLNNIGLPLFYTSPTQINAQIPPNLAAGNYPLVVRSITKQASSAAQQITVSQYAPAVLVDGKGTPLVFHADGVQVSKENPAERDEHLTMYAVGLGATKGGPVTTGNASPASPLAETSADVKVYFGNPLYKQSEVIVDFSGLTPGFVGLYQINFFVLGQHTGIPACDDITTVAPGANFVQSNLTVSFGGAFSFDGAAICFDSSS